MILVGRQAQVDRLRSILEFNKRAAGEMTILGIYGPGGVGKSSLISMAEKEIDYKRLKTLRIFMDSSESVTSLIDFIARLVNAIKHEAKRRYSRGDIVLKETEKAIYVSKELLSEAQSEISNHGDPEAIARLYHRATALGKTINKISTKTKNYVDFEMIEDSLTPEASESIAAFQDEIPKWWNALGIGSERKNLRNAIRKNAAQVFATALERDLETILSGYNFKNANKPLPAKIDDCDRLLIVIDDFESISEITAEFLARYFLPKLRDARYKSAIVIVGRDDFTGTNPSWDQHLHAHIEVPGIDVGPLSKAEIGQIAKIEGVDSDLLWRDTDGYPYFIQLWIENIRNGGESASSLKKFYDRTTRWMSDTQKGWLDICLFIDEVNIDSLSKFTATRSEAAIIFNWFTEEGSIRDTRAKYFTIRSYVRGRLLEYLKVCEPSRFLYHAEKARSLDFLK